MDGGKKASVSKVNIFMFSLLLPEIPYGIDIKYQLTIKRTRYDHGPPSLKITTCLMGK